MAPTKKATRSWWPSVTGIVRARPAGRRFCSICGVGALRMLPVILEEFARPLWTIWLMVEVLLLFLYDLFIAKITGWVRCPDVTCYRFRPSPKISITDIQPAARSTAPRKIGFAIPQFFEEWVPPRSPNGAKGTPPDVPQRNVSPELIGMHLSVPTDTPDPLP